MNEIPAPRRSHLCRRGRNGISASLVPFLVLLAGCLAPDRQEPSPDDDCLGGSATCVTRPQVVFNTEGRTPNYPPVTLEKPILIRPFSKSDSGLGLEISYNGVPYALSAVVRVYDALQLPFVSSIPLDSFYLDSSSRSFIPMDSLAAILKSKMKPSADSTYPFNLEIESRTSLRAAWVFGWEWDSKANALGSASGESAEMRLITGAFQGRLKEGSRVETVPGGTQTSLIFIQGTRYVARMDSEDTVFTLGYLPRGKYRVLLVNAPEDSLPDWTDLDVLELKADSDTSAMETYFSGAKVGTIRLKGKL